MKRTSIIIDPKTRDMLKSIGTKAETYDAIIRRLIAEREKVKSK